MDNECCYDDNNIPYDGFIILDDEIPTNVLNSKTTPRCTDYWLPNGVCVYRDAIDLVDCALKNTNTVI